MQMEIPSADAPHPYIIPFSSWHRIVSAILLVMIAATGALLAMRGLSFGLDFTGGLAIAARSAVPFDLAEIRAALASAGHADAVIQLSDAGRAVLVRVQDPSGEAGTLVRAALGTGAQIVSQESVGPKVSQDLLRSGLTASISAVFAIGLYVWLRFETRFGISAFLTILHDVILVLGFYALTGLTFDLTSVAALLLVAGYSINDTVVVFDRVREMLRRQRLLPLARVIDEAVQGTLRRTLMTSATTLATTVALMIFGGPMLFGFAAATTFGIVLGTLSSIFVAAPLLLSLPGALPVKNQTDGSGDRAP